MQLLGLGLSPRQISYLLSCGQLHRLHRGVYALGHRNLTQQGRWMAAVLAAGPRAVLSHVSAGIHWLLLTPASLLPHVTVPHKGRRRPGIRHHVAALRADEVTARDGIPVTTVARTLLDLAAVLDPHRLERAVAEAEYRRYADSPSLLELIERYPGRRGVARLKATIASRKPQLGITRSRLEQRFLRFLDRRRLERPELNAPLELADGFISVDCLWRRQRVALELDGRAAHLRASTWEADRRRDRRLLGAGWRPVRITARQLRAEPDEVARDLRALGINEVRQERLLVPRAVG